MDVRLYSSVCLIILFCVGYSERVKKHDVIENHCGQYYVPCDNQECISRLNWCNGEHDCVDMSDEAYCQVESWFRPGVDHKCTVQHFECDSKQCVPFVTLCDGYENCKDGSDETHCEVDSLEIYLTNETSYSEEELNNDMPTDYYTMRLAPPTTINTDYDQYTEEDTIPPFPLRRNITCSMKEKISLSSFSFRQNYTQHFRYRYKNSIQRAESWILNQRDNSYGWKEVTARALVALSLVNNSFLSNAAGNNFMKKSLQMHLGVKLLTELNRDNPLNIDRKSFKLAQYINALLATCQDSRDFFGQDLVDRLWHMKNQVIERRKSLNPFIFITLCLVNANITDDDVKILENLLLSEDSDQRLKDIQVLATSALACIEHNNPKPELKRKVEKALNDLHNQKLHDGSFGSVHTTAIAAQALLSGNIEWDPVHTLDYLSQHQFEDGSFGNMVATYYILPTLSGRSLLHLRNTRCEPSSANEEGLLIKTFYTVKIGHPPTASIPNSISVPGGTNFFDVLQIAQLLNPVFKFSYYNSSGKTGVHAISDVMNDPEHGFYWHLYVDGNQTVSYPNQHQEYTGDIRQLYPKDSEELVYWYHNL